MWKEVREIEDGSLRGKEVDGERLEGDRGLVGEDLDEAEKKSVLEVREVGQMTSSDKDCMMAALRARVP